MAFIPHETVWKVQKDGHSNALDGSEDGALCQCDGENTSYANYTKESISHSETKDSRIFRLRM